MADTPATTDPDLERATNRLVDAIAPLGARFRAREVVRVSASKHAATWMFKEHPIAWAMAAGLLLMLGAAGIWSVRARHSVGQVYAAAAGQRIHFVLSDGTRITLAPASRLNVPADYAKGARTVQLTGEAYFAVVHDTWHPFAVLANDVNITDVGTEFDVRAYDAAVRVAVAEGAVALVGAGRGNGAIGFPRPSMNRGTVSRTRPSPPTQTSPSFQEIPLFAGDMAEVVNGVPMVTHHADLAAATAWTQGGLVFQGTPFRDVVRALARTFDLEITVADTALANRTVTATIGNEPVDDVLEAVTRVIGADAERHGRVVVIRRRVVNTRRPGAPSMLNAAQAN